MSEDLRIPLAAVPGFDATGLRVFAMDQQWLCVGDGGCEGLDLMGWGLDDTVAVPRQIVALNLSDASTRDRLARWCAGRVGFEPTLTAPRFDWDGLDWTADDLDHVWRSGPDFSGIDHRDDTRLPDGSRRVDAIALGRVAVHLGAS